MTLVKQIPLSTIIARATRIANSDLPVSKLPPTVDELFDDIVGLTTTPKISGPLYTAVTVTDPPPTPQTTFAVDVLDILTGAIPATTPAKVPSYTTTSPKTQLVSIKVPRVDEQRGAAFLANMKTLLEEKPE